MFEVEIGGKKRKAAVTFYTAQVYEMEFGSDLIQDFLGVVGTDSLIETDGESIAKIDFTKTNWTGAMKALWAALKTADDKLPGYTQWSRKVSGVNLWLAQDQLGYEISDCFFRADTAGEEA